MLLKWLGLMQKHTIQTCHSNPVVSFGSFLSFLYAFLSSWVTYKAPKKSTLCWMSLLRLWGSDACGDVSLWSRTRIFKRTSGPVLLFAHRFCYIDWRATSHRQELFQSEQNILPGVQMGQKPLLRPPKHLKEHSKPPQQKKDFEIQGEDCLVDTPSPLPPL